MLNNHIKYIVFYTPSQSEEQQINIIANPSPTSICGITTVMTALSRNDTGHFFAAILINTMAGS